MSAASKSRPTTHQSIPQMQSVVQQLLRLKLDDVHCRTRFHDVVEHVSHANRILRILPQKRQTGNHLRKKNMSTRTPLVSEIAHVAKLVCPQHLSHQTKSIGHETHVEIFRLPP